MSYSVRVVLKFSSFVIWFIFLIQNKVSCSTVYRFTNNNLMDPFNLSQGNEENVIENSLFYFMPSDYSCREPIDTQCKEMYESVGYPYKEILDFVRKNKNDSMDEPYSDETTIQNYPRVLATQPRSAIDSSIEYRISVDLLQPMPRVNKQKKPLCREIRERKEPLVWKDDNGKNHYIVNVPNYRQIMNVIKCLNADAQCGDGSKLPETRSSSCVQEYQWIPFESFEEGKSITPDSKESRKIKVPSGCICRTIRN